MGLWGRAKKAVKRVGSKASDGLKKIVRKTPVMQARKYFGRGPDKPKLDEDEGLRGEAAKRLVDTQRQAGGAQIKFQTEEYE